MPYRWKDGYIVQEPTPEQQLKNAQLEAEALRAKLAHACVEAGALRAALRRYLDADAGRDKHGDTPAAQARRALGYLD